jgi:uncharacterized protein (DUF1330 family)
MIDKDDPLRKPMSKSEWNAIRLIGAALLLWGFAHFVLPQHPVATPQAPAPVAQTTAADAQAPPQAAEPAPAPPPPAPLLVTDTELYAAFHANEIAGMQKYGGHPLVVAGTVHAIQTDLEGRPEIVMEGGGDFQRVVFQYYTDDEQAKGRVMDYLATLHIGQRFFAACAYDEMAMGMVYLKCTLPGGDHE